MQPAGLSAFAARLAHKSGIYSYEEPRGELEEPFLGILKKNAEAWRFFQAQAPSYRRTVAHWVHSAKKEETRLKRLEKLIQIPGARKRL